jgi:hypothetical protein
MEQTPTRFQFREREKKAIFCCFLVFKIYAASPLDRRPAPADVEHKQVQQLM